MQRGKKCCYSIQRHTIKITSSNYICLEFSVVYFTLEVSF